MHSILPESFSYKSQNEEFQPTVTHSRAVIVAAPRDEIRQASTIFTFQKRLKTFLFQYAMCIILFSFSSNFMKTSFCLGAHFVLFLDLSSLSSALLFSELFSDVLMAFLSIAWRHMPTAAGVVKDMTPSPVLN